MNKVESMIDQTNIERVVMRRVRIIRILALIISTAVLAGITFVVALWGIGKEVWVAHVFQNGPQDYFGRTGYLWYAFLHTRFIVQVLILLTLGCLLFLIRETVRFFISSSTSPRTV